MSQQKKTKKTPWPQRILYARVSSFSILVIALIVAVVTFFVTKGIDLSNSEKQNKDNASGSEESQYEIKRAQGFSFIKPLISAKPVNEYDGYQDIKESAEEVIKNFQNSGVISSASVYFRDFDKSNWFCINGDIKYSPGSILKVPAMMTILKMEESRPELLNKVLAFDALPPKDKDVHIFSKSLQHGKSYTIRELLYYMIAYSDNNAPRILDREIDKAGFAQMFVDLGLAKPDWNGKSYPVTVKECSVFLEALFNASYLNEKNSEYAMSLLTKSDFKDGIVKGIGNPNVLIAHKFGEAGTNTNMELHETAIFYINNKPYLITIMTRGNNNIDMFKLEPVIQSIARQIYNGVVAKGNNI